jgi:two-component system, cell cycle sensor histidine kinase and response regulator CckA
MDTKRRTILVVDDDSNIRRLVEVLLEDAGYSVLVAADGIEGINVFKRHQPEIALLITDVMMPNMNGFDLADSVLELDSDLPVIFMSGNICCADRGHGCLAKPFPTSAVVSSVRQALHTAAAPSAVPEDGAGP